MRGSIRKRSEDSWNIILDVGYQVDPDIGKQKRVQKWFTVAERKLTELLHQLKPTDIKRYYNDSALSSTTIEQHQTILHSALKGAQLQSPEG